MTLSVDLWRRWVAGDFRDSSEEDALVCHYADVILIASSDLPQALKFIVRVLDQDPSERMQRRLCDGPICTLVDHFSDEQISSEVDALPDTPTLEILRHILSS